jgi:hypothetical protein
MWESVIESYHQENDKWRRLLDFFKEQSAFLKTRLALVLERRLTDAGFLQQAEYYQNELIVRDQAIAILRHDIHSQEKLLVAELEHNGQLPEVMSQQEKMRKDMQLLEKEFNKTRRAFYSFLSKEL